MVKNLYILSTRPFKRLVFLHVKSLNKEKKINNVVLVNFSFFSNLGSFSIFVFIKNIVALPSTNFLFSLGFVVDNNVLLFLKKMFYSFI